MSDEFRSVAWTLSAAFVIVKLLVVFERIRPEREALAMIACALAGVIVVTFAQHVLPKGDR